MLKIAFAFLLPIILISMPPLFAFQGFELKANPQGYEKAVDWQSMLNIVLDKQGSIELLKENRLVQKKTKLKDLTRNPVADLDECPCRNTRLRNPGIRQWVEDEVIKNITQKYPEKEKLLTYVSTGSGKLFQDLMMLSRLIKEGYSKIRYILIDDSFQSLIKVVTKHGISHLDLFGVYPTNHPIKSFESDSRMQQLNDKFVQFVRFFENIIRLRSSSYAGQEGNCDLQILIYGKHDSMCDTYVLDCANNPELKADIVVGIDIEEGQSYNRLEPAIACMVKDEGMFFAYMQSGRTIRLESDKMSKVIIDNALFKVEYDLLQSLGKDIFDQWLADPCDMHD